MTKICLVLILFVCIFSASGFANWQTADLEGEWVNVNPRTRGVTTLAISKAGTGWGIEAWGKCHPHDCVWGFVVVAPVGDSVSDVSFNRGFAIWNVGFATKYVTLALNKDRLTAEVITIFNDRSWRANNRHVDIFLRADERFAE